MRNRWIWLGAIVVAAAAGIGLWQAMGSSEKGPRFQTSPAARGDIEVTISAAGKIIPKETVTVGAQVSGQLVALLVDVGDQVEQGQLLARIDATIAETNVAASQAQLDELLASQRQQEATLALARANAQRAAMLYEGHAIALAEHEAAKADEAVAEGRLDAIRAQIVRQSSTLRAQKATLGFTNIYAPISGTVVSVQAVEGQTLNANQTAPTILTLADLTVMTVHTDVSEADVLRIRPGQDAWFSTLGDPDLRWQTSVRQVLPTPEILNDVVLYKALLDVANPDDILKPQMTAQVFFLTGAARDTIIVPVTALRPARPRLEGARDRAAPAQERPSGPPEGGAALQEARRANPEAQVASVMVLPEDGDPVRRLVLIGLRTRTQAQVLYGLEPGEMVVTGELPSQKPGEAARPAGGRPAAGTVRRF